MKHDVQQLRTIADAQADAVARWRASKRAQRLAQHRRRMEGKNINLMDLPQQSAAWLAAVERDDRRDEREPALEERTA